jgi:hypothetical protein
MKKLERINIKVKIEKDKKDLDLLIRKTSEEKTVMIIEEIEINISS